MPVDSRLAAGHSYEPQTEGKLLFLEDVSAKPYQIDRMLWQLQQAGKLDDVRGIIFGEMLDCTSPGAAPELLDEVILRVFDNFAGPSPSAYAVATSPTPTSLSPSASKPNFTLLIKRNSICCSRPWKSSSWTRPVISMARLAKTALPSPASREQQHYTRR